MLLTPPTVVHPKKLPEAYKENEEVSAVVASQTSISENLTSRYASLKGLTEEDKEEKTQQFGSFDSSQAAIATELTQDTTAPSYRLQDYFVTEASPSSMPDSVSVIEPQAGQENSYQKNQP